jgi:dethiobiotin synthetase
MTARGVFVTGTDTGVGKTVVSAALLARYRGEIPVRYWKPVQTGIEQDDDTEEVARLSGCRDAEVRRSGVRLPRPVSPHLAARLSGVRIALEPLVDVVRSNGADAAWIVEGAGGVIVPINESETMADLMCALGLPVVVAARSTLGTINHTLLTLEALRHRALTAAGVVMVGPPDTENRAAIERYGRASVLGELPRFDNLTPEALQTWASAHLDPEGRLLSVLRETL